MKQKSYGLTRSKGCVFVGGDLSLGHYLYPHMTTSASVIGSPEQMLDLFQSYLAPFRMPFFLYIRLFDCRYIDSVPWGNCLDKRIWNIFWVLALWAWCSGWRKCAEPVAGA